MSSDREWEKWGRVDPYYGVLTDERFRSGNLTPEARVEFFESGRSHITAVMDSCRNYFGDSFAPRRVLDFGCGTGRLLIPLAEIAEQAVGIDVAESMLREAKKNCVEFGVDNVRLLTSVHDLAAGGEKFDLIHSFIVFQHIPVARGRRIFGELLDLLTDGGVGAIHFTYAKAAYAKNRGVEPRLRKIIRRLDVFPLARNLKRSILKSGRRGDPDLQMNPYSLNELCFTLQAAGIREIHLEFTNHRGEWGVVLYFRRPAK
jgi:ubiquinone/menaquinone biosynthesis C-methylase UbiE